MKKAFVQSYSTLLAAALLLGQASFSEAAEDDTDSPPAVSAVTIAPPAKAVSQAIPDRKREFHIINLSLPRTGSTSISGIFDKLHSSHEFMMEETIVKILEWRAAKLTDEDLDKYLIARDQVHQVQVDSTTFLHLAQDRLFVLFPDAKYLLCVRDGEQWFVSYVDLLVAFARLEKETPEDEMGLWAERYGKLLSPHFRKEMFANTETLGKELERQLPDFAAYWGTWTLDTIKNMQKLPKEQRFIIKTVDISRSLEALSAFAGVPVSALNDRRTHLNKRRKVVNVIQLVGKEKIQKAFQPWQTKVDALLKAVNGSRF